MVVQLGVPVFTLQCCINSMHMVVEMTLKLPLSHTSGVYLIVMLSSGHEAQLPLGFLIQRVNSAHSTVCSAVD